eukprot:TRINITY_DN2310_c0_g2_i1.p1 TRINITY_DN2310_c0_g2~~TRINITY_DN2310_c0_g2_i1.p1  ORF type:complete len:570 (-),score=234.78 TRINITY_DN2310_c0_g2_i1:30-1739(-)
MSLEVKLISTNDIIDIDKDERGIFFSGNCYVITNKEENLNITYFWIGSESSKEDKEASEKYIQQISHNTHNSKSIISEAREPFHFIRTFGLGIIIFKGKRIEPKQRKEKQSLFRIRATKPGEIRCIEVKPEIASLDSGDCFCFTGNLRPVYIWFGKYSNEEERNMAKELSIKIAFDVPPKMFEESREPDLFWRSLGSKDQSDRIYSNKQPESIEEPPKRTPKLFKYSNDHNKEKLGEFSVDEIPNFSKNDLDSDDVMLLDCYDELFIWLGKNSNEEERKETTSKANEIAKSHIMDDSTFSSERLTYSAITFMEQDSEPSYFRTHFEGWSTEKEVHEKQEKEKQEKEKQEKERLEKEHQEKQRLEKEKQEKENQEKQEKERLEKENQEKERLEKEKQEKEKQEKQRIEKEHQEKQEKERLEKENQEKERLEKENQEKESLEKEKQEKEKQEKQRIEKEKQEKQRLEKEHQEKQEKERLEKEKQEKEKQEKQRIEKEHQEKQEEELLEKEKQEKENHEKELLEREKLEKERVEQQEKPKEQPKVEPKQNERSSKIIDNQLIPEEKKGCTIL